MRIVFLFFILLVTVKLKSQVLCGTAGEGGTVTLTAPTGHVFISVEFASYGTPNGSCGAFTVGSCHSASSGTVSFSTFVGHNSASVAATNGVFGDPCVGTVKRLYVQARYDAIVPLSLNSFTARKLSPRELRLDWESKEEINTSHFIIEKSTDGKTFEDAGLVKANGEGSGNYSFIAEMSSAGSMYFFRLRMIDQDGKMKFSNIVRVNSGLSQVKFQAYPNPAGKFITVINDRPQEAVITNLQGMFIRKFLLVNGTQTIDISGFRPGIYFIKSATGAVKIIKN